jgi:hypothetical protein
MHWTLARIFQTSKKQKFLPAINPEPIKLEKVTVMSTEADKMNQIIPQNQSLPSLRSLRVAPSTPAPVARQDTITVSNGFRGQEIRVRAKQINVDGHLHMVDPYQLMGMIKNVTQTIGKYKNMQTLYGDLVVTGLRKVRRDMVSHLESNFRIHWGLDEQSVSMFYM